MRAAEAARVVAASRDWIGTPYHDQASVRGAGCDCLGLVRGVWREVVGSEPFALPAYSRGWGEVGHRELMLEGARSVMIEIAVPEMVPGALLIFRIRPRSVAKHCGILSGASAFIHATERAGVAEQVLVPLWRRRIAGAFLFPSAAG
jgi:NlpC/P60 family putative phage cell wall peptidase